MSVAVAAEKATVPRVNGQKVTVICLDGTKFVKPQEVFSGSSVTLSGLLEEFPDELEFSRVEVPGRVFGKALEYFEMHYEDPTEEGDGKPKEKPEEISARDAEFLDQLEKLMVFELILAADYLDAQDLLDLTCQHVANMIKGMTPDQIRKYFGIENAFSPEDEEKVKQEYAWAFE